MADLSDLVLKKITELGPTKAAQYFGKSNPTIFSWRKKPASIPIDAVQKVLTERGMVLPEQAPPSPQVPVLSTPAVTPTPVTQPPAAPQPRSPIIEAPMASVAMAQMQPIAVRPAPTANDYAAFVEDTQKRLDKLENFARMMTDPDLSPQVRTSLLRPGQPLQSTPAAEVTSPAFQSPPVEDNTPPMGQSILRPREPSRR